MNRGILAVAALAAALSAVASASSASANAAIVRQAAVYCGPFGCGPVWSGPRRWEGHWGPWNHISSDQVSWNQVSWDHVYRPACPLDYHYACRRGPLGYGQCACWPYPPR
jgi:hypothetical protein